MKRKNNFTDTSVSFEDFEQALMSGQSDAPVDELVKERLSQEKEARKKETALKKARRKKN